MIFLYSDCEILYLAKKIKRSSDSQMKNIAKNTKRLISLVLSLCMVAVSLTGAIVVSADEAVPDTGLIECGNMENFEIGIQVFTGYGNNSEVVETEAYTGSKSLHLKEHSANSVFTGLTSVTDPDKTYLFSAYLKINSLVDSEIYSSHGAPVYAKFQLQGGGELTGGYYGGTNHLLYNSETYGEWVKVSKVITGAAVTSLVLYVFSNDAYVDDISLVELPDTGLIAGGNMEDKNVGDKAFNSWGNNSEVVTTDSYTGAKSLHLKEHDNNKIFANLTSVTDPAKSYLFSAYIKVNSIREINLSDYGSHVYVKFQLQGGGELDGNFGDNHLLYKGTTNGEWVRVATLVSGAAISTLAMYVFSDDAYVDDVSLVEVNIPDTGLIAGGNMEDKAVGDKAFYGWGNNSEVVTNDSYTGAKSLRLKEYNGNVVFAELTSATDPAKTYMFSAYIKVNSTREINLSDYGSHVYAKFLLQDGGELPGNHYNNHKLYTGTTNGEWVKISTTFTGAAISHVALYVFSNDTYVDDISLVELGPKITSASITAGTDITVNYYADYAEGASMKFTVNEEEVMADGYYNAEIDKYVYRFPNIAPDRLNDEIKAELIKDNQVVAVKEGFTVKQYLDTVLSKTAEDLGMAEEKFAKLKTLAADLLHYGAAAQKYFDYKTDELVNDGVTEGTAFVAPTTTDKDVTNKSANGVTFSGQNLRFDNVNRLMFRFKVDSSVITDITKLSIKIAVGNELKTVTSEDFENAGADTYIVYTDDIYATEFDDVFTVTACVDGTDGANVKYSVNSYVYAMCNSTTASEKMVELAKATYNYGLSATAYIQ